MKQMVMILLASLGAMLSVPTLAQPLGTVMAAETKQSFILRSRNQIPSLTGDTVIYIHSIAANRIREEHSFMAARDDDGGWTISAMGERGPAAESIAISVIPEKKRKLSKAEGAILNRLLGDTSLYTAISTLPREPDRNATYHMMEVVTPGHRVVVRWVGILPGVPGQVAGIVMDAGTAKRRPGKR